MRPRDLIHFFNTCISRAGGKATISPQLLREAEGVYSRERLRALADEWFGIYPNLMHLTKLLVGRREAFVINEISSDEVDTNCLELLTSGSTTQSGEDMALVNLFVNGSMTLNNYLESIVQIFYKVGLVGLKVNKISAVSWSDSFGQSVSRAEIKSDSKVYIHPVYWRTLGIGGNSIEDIE
jgi:hypothetical protein